MMAAFVVLVCYRSYNCRSYARDSTETRDGPQPMFGYWRMFRGKSSTHTQTGGSVHYYDHNNKKDNILENREQYVLE